jgi:hypothetical protein
MKSIQQNKVGKKSPVLFLFRNMLIRFQEALWQNTRKGKFPDFLIIGAQKAGTTSLFHYLSQHPSIQPPSTKEIHYYDLYYHKGANWYKKNFGLTDNAKITGEATPYYLFHPFVPERVYRDNPYTKMIVLLRHPGERAFSHYQMMRRMNLEAAVTFSEAVKNEPASLKKGLKMLYNNALSVSAEHQHYTYLSRGKYEKQLRRWFGFFPAKQFLIIKAEDFFENPIKVLADVYTFLGIAIIYPKDISKMNKGESECFDANEKKRAESYFRSYNKKLELLLGTTFNWES